MLPNFLVGQEISAFDKNNKIVEGKIIVTSRGTKVCLTESCAKIPVSSLNSIRSVGKNLKEEVEDNIKALSDKIDWAAASKAPDKDKVIKAFVDTVSSSSDDANKEDIEKAAQEEANMQLMQTKIDSGTSTASTELEKYMKDKADKVQEAETKIRKNILKEGDKQVSRPLDYGEDNVYPAALNAAKPEVVDNSYLEEDPNARSVEDDVDADIKAYDDTGSKMQPMTTDMEIAQGTPVDSSEANEKSNEVKDALNYIDDGLKDDSVGEKEDIPDTDNSGSQLDNLKDKLVSDYEMPEDDANRLVSDVKSNVETTVSNVVKDTLSSVIKTPVETTEDVTNENVPEDSNESVSSDAAEDNSEDDVDKEVEEAIDDYESGDNYSDEGMYESLCTKFNIQNGDKLLEESNNCIPDAVLLLAEQVRTQRLTEALVNKVANEIFDMLFGSLTEKSFKSNKVVSLPREDVDKTLDFLASDDFTKFIKGSFADKLSGRNNIQFLREITENFSKFIKKYFNDKFDGINVEDTSKEYGIELFIEDNKSSLGLVRNYLLRTLEKFEGVTFSNKPTVKSYTKYFI